ncbi:unnamed protein product [Vitrella brassicaformis CCMP3155]|uniref:Uncharacterized protein n=2 Tax=Vitrella brassicaformis TaxID=1169539 RepID=A0A0G4EY14_VITBC|nr:unnamed protein product [Vitrella brassicaformis CCMP3155]|eukprot:CEM03616.1 unnamed protein product [Vitrella brassicaformis CCMP3155]
MATPVEGERSELFIPLKGDKTAATAKARLSVFFSDIRPGAGKEGDVGVGDEEGKQADEGAPQDKGSDGSAAPSPLAKFLGVVFKADTKAREGAKEEAATSALHDLAGVGLLPQILLLVKQGADVTSLDRYGRTALHWAASCGHRDIIIELQRLGTDVNAQDKEKKTALHLATAAGQIETCRALLELKADLEARDQRGRTALHLGVLEGSSRVVNHLIEGGANLEAKDHRGATALILAIERGNVNVLRTLLHANASINVRLNGYTPIHIACSTERLACLDLLLEHGGSAFLDTPDAEGMAPLHHATFKANVKTCFTLIRGYAKIEMRDPKGRTPLHFAAELGELDVAATLLEHGAKLDLTDNGGRTPLHSAVLHGQREVAELLLLNASFNVKNARTKMDETALHLAVRRRSAPLVERLLCHSCNPNVAGHLRNTPLHAAAEIGDTEVVQMLLQTSPVSPLSPGRSPSRQPRPGSRSSASSSHSSRGSAASVVAAIKAKPLCQVNAINERGQTALHRAAYKGRAKACQALLDAGASVDVQDNDKNIPLSCAISQNHAECVNVFLTHDSAAFHVIDQYGLQALQRACLGGTIAVTKLLTALNAFPQDAESYRLDPYSIAMELGHADLLPLLGETAPGEDLQLEKVASNDPHSFICTISQFEKTRPQVLALVMQILDCDDWIRNRSPQRGDSTRDGMVVPSTKLLVEKLDAATARDTGGLLSERPIDLSDSMDAMRGATLRFGQLTENSFYAIRLGATNAAGHAWGPPVCVCTKPDRKESE